MSKVAGNGVSGLLDFKILGGSMPPDPPSRLAPPVLVFGNYPPKILDPPLRWVKILMQNHAATARERTSSFRQETGLFLGLVNPEMGAGDAMSTCVREIVLNYLPVQ